MFDGIIVRSGIAGALLGFVITILPEIAVAQSITTTITMHMPDGSTPSVPASGPRGMTVERAMQLGGLKYNATYYKGLGYALMQVSGQPPQTSGDLKQGEPFWLLCVNDLLSDKGMSSKKLRRGDRVDWYWITSGQGKCPKDK